MATCFAFFGFNVFEKAFQNLVYLKMSGIENENKDISIELVIH